VVIHDRDDLGSTGGEPKIHGMRLECHEHKGLPQRQLRSSMEAGIRHTQQVEQDWKSLGVYHGMKKTFPWRFNSLFFSQQSCLALLTTPLSSPHKNPISLHLAPPPTPSLPITHSRFSRTRLETLLQRLSSWETVNIGRAIYKKKSKKNEKWKMENK